MLNDKRTLPALRGTAQLLTTIPYTFNYTPARSLVLAAGWLDDATHSPTGMQQSTLELTVRLDLPSSTAQVAQALAVASQAMARAVHERFPDRWTRSVDGSLAWADPDRPALFVFVLAYDADDDIAAELTTQCFLQLPQIGAYVHDLLVEREERYLPVVHTGEVVADRLGEETLVHTEQDWLPVPGAEEVPAVADLVLAGRSPARSREDVVASVRARDDRAAAATQLAEDLLWMDPSRLDEEAALGDLGRWVVAGEELTPKQRAAIGVTLLDRFTRDVVLSRWVPTLFPPDAMETRPGDDRLAAQVPTLVGADRTEILDRLLILAARLPESLTPPVLTLAGCVAWSTGDGTIANETVALALEREPGYRMAALLQAILERGISPRTVAAHSAA